MNNKSHLSYLKENCPWLMKALRPISSLMGLDNRWEMFSYAHRVYSVPVVTAQKSSQHVQIVKRTPSDSEGYANKYLHSFRDEKYFLNTFGQKKPITAYLKWICRNSSAAVGTNNLKFEYLQYQIVAPDQAATTGQALHPLANKKVLEIPCVR